jgi:hypothetical protein
MPPKKPRSADYEIGYGKPPRHTRFRPGVSGNPAGRPRGVTAGRANRLLLKEAYRSITLREGNSTLTLPALQAAVRQLLRVGLKGNALALRDYIAVVQAIEQSAAMRTPAKVVDEEPPPYVTDELRVQAFENFLKRTNFPRK